jgi:hypothetical protein
MKKNKVLLMISGVGLMFPLFGVGIATASFMPGGIGTDWYDLVLNPEGGDVLERITSSLTETDEVMQVMMGVAFGEDWNDLLTTSGSSMPNPYEVRTDDETSGAGVLTVSPIVKQRDVSNLYDQELGRSLASSMLGEKGETAVKEEGDRISSILDTNQQGMETTQQLAEDSQSMTVTQDVMKNQAQMNAALAGIITNTAELTADNRLALLEMQRLDSIIAQLSANTSEGIDESNRRERVERRALSAGASRAPIYIPGLLRTNESDTPQGEGSL